MGAKFVERIITRIEDRDVDPSMETRDAQLDAYPTWGVPDSSKLNRLAGITQPVLVANGDNDRMIPTKRRSLSYSRTRESRRARSSPGMRMARPGGALR